VRAWRETAKVAAAARQNLLLEGKPVFIITDHYGLAGEFSFYLPEGRATLRGEPLVYSRPSPIPNNQLCFWPEYRYEQYRAGENAIYVAEVGPFPLEKGWIMKWLRKKPIAYGDPGRPPVLPPQLFEQFDSVSDLGPFEVKLGNHVYRRLQLFACRNLHKPDATP
jgi:hypothetical protein